MYGIVNGKFQYDNLILTSYPYGRLMLIGVQIDSNGNITEYYN
jgi:hypothetical protein